MALLVNVAGGAGSGHKRPLHDKPKDWVHVCPPCEPYASQGGRVLAAHWAACPDCGRRRPRAGMASRYVAQAEVDQYLVEMTETDPRKLSSRP
jgi:hypothetical protein